MLIFKINLKFCYFTRNLYLKTEKSKSTVVNKKILIREGNKVHSKSQQGKKIYGQKIIYELYCKIQYKITNLINELKNNLKNN